MAVNIINSEDGTGGLYHQDSSTMFVSCDSSGNTKIGTATISATEIGFIDGVTAGTVAASKAIVVDANKDASIARNFSAVNLIAGASGTAGSAAIFPTTASKGKILVSATANTNDDITTITNAVQGGAYTYTIPDAGASSSFVMLAGNQTITGVKTFSGTGTLLTSSNQTDLVQPIPCKQFTAYTGTWTMTRNAVGDYVVKHTAAAETSLIQIDVTNYIRTATSKGFMLTGFSYDYKIGTDVVTAHSMVLKSTLYANNTAHTVSDIPLTVTLSTATQAQPYLTAGTITTPAFLNVAMTKYAFEISAQFTATCAYETAGIFLTFSRNLL